MSDDAWFQQFLGSITGRDIAIVLWIGALALFLLQKAGIRKSVFRLPGNLVNIKVTGSFLSVALYASVVVVVLRNLGFWDFSLLKDTIYWYFVVGVPLLVTSAIADSGAKLVKHLVADNIRAVVLLEFLVNTFTFPLGIELFLVPTACFLGLLPLVFENKREHESIAEFAKAASSIFGLAVLGYICVRIFSEWNEFVSFETVRNLTFPLVMSAVYVPFLYVVLLVVTYEKAFVWLKLGCSKEPNIIAHARKQIFLQHGLNIRKLREFINKNRFQLKKIRTKEDIARILRQ